MYEINLNIEAALVWYYLLVAGVLMITAWASWRHNSPMPFAWGLILGILVLWLKDYIAPILFGVLNYSWESHPILFAVTGLFAVGWFGYILLTMYNLVTSGEAWQ